MDEADEAAAKALAGLIDAGEKLAARVFAAEELKTIDAPVRERLAMARQAWDGALVAYLRAERLRYPPEPPVRRRGSRPPPKVAPKPLTRLPDGPQDRATGS